MKLLYVAAFGEPQNNPWFSLGRQRKVTQVAAMLSTVGYEVIPLSIAPAWQSGSSQGVISLCQSGFAPVRFVQLLLTSFHFFLFSNHLQSASILWLYSTRAAESVVALVGLLLRPRLSLVLQLEDLPSARNANHGFAGFVDHICTYLLNKRANHIFAVSENVAFSFIRLYGGSASRICLLPPALDPLFISKAERRPEPFSSLYTTILYAESFQSDKSATDLIEAFLRLPSGSFKLILVRSAPSELIHQYHHVDNIMFTGVIDTEHLFDFYTSADVVVNPHRVILNPSHVFPFKLLETIASGALPLTTPVPGSQAFSLPQECFFQGVDDLFAKLIQSKNIWALNESQIYNSAMSLMLDHSFDSVCARLHKAISTPSSSRS